MASPWTLLNGLWGSIRAPKVPDAELQERLREIRGKLPEPVFWLLGKAQSGKTSLIRALTGSTRAAIGGGFRPCTRTAQLYPFPNEEECFLHFLDTRGLGEVDYDPAEDMKVLEGQAHCLIVVIRAMDHAQRCVLDPLRAVLKAHPDWPLIVVQTALHEGYPAAGTPHAVPYCYAEPPYPQSVSEDLARSLAAQRAWFARYDARIVPVDFTLPEDGYEPEHYGLEALWAAIEEAVPLGLRGMLLQKRRPLRDVYFRAAHPHVVSYSVAAGAAAGLPVPMVDIPLLAAIQAKMFHSIASIYGQKVTAQRMAEILSTLGIGFAARMGGRELLKLIPGFGSAVAAVFAGAATYALGCTLCAYFSFALDGDVPDKELLRELYEKEYQEGRRRLGAYLETGVRSQGAGNRGQGADDSRQETRDA
jgi:uncharacterized protein (DUF697 family)